MPLGTPIFFGPNLLAVTVATGGSLTSSGDATGFPARRVADYDITLPWTSSSGSGGTIHLDQGTVTYPAQSAVIAAGHNLQSASVVLQYSADDAFWTTQASATPSGTGVLVMLGAAEISARYWRLVVSGALTAPSLAELVIAPHVTWDGPPAADEPEYASVSIAGQVRSIGAYTWNVDFGAPLWRARWVFPAQTAAQRDATLAGYAATRGGARPGFVTDPDGITRWVEWSGTEVSTRGYANDRWVVGVEFQETR